MVKSCKHRVVGSVLALLLLSAAVAQAAQPPVLQQVPDDAGAVLVVKNLKQLSTKLSNAGTRMKLPVPEDLLATVMGKFGLADGLDQNGSMALVVLDVGKDPTTVEDAPLAFIIPTTDSKAMLQSLESQAPDAAGIMKVTFLDRPGVAMMVGKYVVVAPGKAGMTRYLAHTGTLDKKLSPESLAAFDANDMVLYANVPAFGPKAGAALDAAHGRATIGLTAGALDKTAAALGDEAVGSMFTLARQFLKDSSAALVTFRMNDDGATFGAIGQFTPDSPLGKFVAAQKAAPSANLNGLPNGRILGAVAGNWDKASIGPIINQLADQVLANPGLKENPALPDLKKVIEAQRALLEGFSGEKAAIYEPTDPAKGWINVVVLADLTEPLKSNDALLAMSKLNILGDQQGIKIDQKVELNAVTVKGVALTRYTITYRVKEGGPRPMPMGMPLPPGFWAALDQLNKLYGADGLSTYCGVVGKQLVCVVSNDMTLVESAIAAAQTGDTALAKSPAIVAAGKGTLPNALAVAYLPITRWVHLGLGQLHLPAGEPPADNATPLSITAAASGPNMTVELQIPMSTMIDLTTRLQDSGILKLFGM